MKDRDGLDRREFTVAAVLAALSGVTITISGCGGGGGSSNPTNPNPVPSTNPGDKAASSISGNHGHTAVIEAARLNSPSTVALDIRGSADHPHSVELTAAQVVDPWAKGKIGLASGTAFDAIPAAQKHDYFAALFSVPMWIAVGCLIVLLFAYPARRTAPASAVSEVPA